MSAGTRLSVRGPSLHDISPLRVKRLPFPALAAKDSVWLQLLAPRVILEELDPFFLILSLDATLFSVSVGFGVREVLGTVCTCMTVWPISETPWRQTSAPTIEV